jgi:PAS domain S-box-containing protein
LIDHPSPVVEDGTELAALRQRVKALEAELADLERTRAALREDHSFRAAIIERAAEGVCVCHAVPTFPYVEFTVWNPRMTELTGYTFEEINRRGWYQTVYPDPDVQEAARQRMDRMRQGEDLVCEPWDIVRADGETRSLGISTSVLTTSDGVVHVLALMQDVTERQNDRRRLEHKLRHLEQLLPICSACKKIRDGSDSWLDVEQYVAENFDAGFTHSMCPECIRDLYPEEPGH